MSCGADTTANTLLTSLLGDKSFTLPVIDFDNNAFAPPDAVGNLYELPPRITNEELTERAVNGSGTFDAIMAGLSVHLQKEYEDNRITGQQYTEAFIAAMGTAVSTAASFLLGRDQAYWQAITAQLQARALEVGLVTARLQLETAKAQYALARAQAQTAEAEYALTKLKLSTEDQQYCLLKSQTQAADYNVTKILPEQWSGLKLDNDTKTYTNANILPSQKAMLLEQIEVQRSQTLNTRTDGQTVTGSVGKQKDLYTQQIISYQRDAEVKAAKLFTDAWITQKTIDEGLLAPNGFTNASLDTILTALKTNNNLV